MQRVGLYLVFTTLIVRTLVIGRIARDRLAAGYAVSAAGYVLNLVSSILIDLPSGPAIVWAMSALAVASAVSLTAVLIR